MKRKWILTLTAAAMGMSLMLAGCGNNGDVNDMTPDGSAPSSHEGSNSNTSQPDDSGILPDMTDGTSAPDSTGGLGDITGNPTGNASGNQNGSR